jgi:hypothetical protein
MMGQPGMDPRYMAQHMQYMQAQQQQQQYMAQQQYMHGGMPPPFG